MRYLKCVQGRPPWKNRWTVLTQIVCNYLPKQSSSWEANGHLSAFLWNPKVHCCVHKNSTLVCILSQMNAVHTLLPCFLNFNMTLPYLRLTLYLASHNQHRKMFQIFFVLTTAIVFSSAVFSIMTRLGKMWYFKHGFHVNKTLQEAERSKILPKTLMQTPRMGWSSFKSFER
jgi:hypothetical protein